MEQKHNIYSEFYKDKWFTLYSMLYEKIGDLNKVDLVECVRSFIS
jgi:hypothetical protein